MAKIQRCLKLKKSGSLLFQALVLLDFLDRSLTLEAREVVNEQRALAAALLVKNNLLLLSRAWRNKARAV